MLFKSIASFLIAVAVILIGGAGYLYFRSIPSTAAIANAQSLDKLDIKLSSEHIDAHLYRTACGSCHYNAANNFSENRPVLADNRIVSNSDPTELINVILYGRASAMPAYGGLSDTEVAMIAAYLRATRTKNATWTDLESKVASTRAKNKSKSGAIQP